MSVATRVADLSQPADQAALVALLDVYARDPMGMERPLPAEVRGALIARLREMPTTHAVLAAVGGAPAGLALCFLGFSSFRARPLLNIHDFVVHPDFRGQGVGRQLMAAVEAHARSLGCCKVTLEVRADNVTARRLYENCGFDAGEEGTSAMSFWTKEL
jgi:ribosomal protein S18 acetylase RimI-like enzyme